MIDFKFKDSAHFYELAVGFAGLALIIVGCLIVMAPFFISILLASIFALSAWPAYEWARHRLGMKQTGAAICVTLLLTTIFVLPLVIIGTSASENFASAIIFVNSSMQDGNLIAFADHIERLPWFGTELAQYWRDILTDTDRIKGVLQSSAKPVSAGLVAVGGTIGTGLLHLIIAIFIAYFFFRHGTTVAVRLRNLSEKFGGERGRHLLEVSKKTLIGVVYGIIGTALAQGALAAFGFWIAGVPAASLLGLLTCFLSFIPIGPPLIWGPAAYWLFTQGETGWAIFLTIWGIAVISAIDNVLKPYFISLGSNLPFVLVLFGIGGGVLAFGFIGIFIGPTLLALAYSLILELSSQRPVALRSDEPKVFE